VKLIDDKVELIITARSISRDEKEYADEKGVTLIEKPIARDALAFMVNIKNPIDNLSIEQIQGIYTRDIVNWSEVGGWDCELHPYVRNRNSGSQEKFETMVMLRLATHSEYVTNVL
jgi:phosphate transport system substrate-binding protein